MKNMPVIGKLLKGICKRAVQRLLEDVSAIVADINKGAALEDVLLGVKQADSSCDASEGR